MSTETTKKKIKIDNGANFAHAYTDKAIDAKLPTDLGASATNLHLLAGATKLGGGINLSGFEYDEATKTLKASGGGGKSVSPALNLLTEDLSAVRTSITEEEKTNLEKGLYNSVLFIDFSLGDDAFAGLIFPQRLASAGGNFMFSSYKAKIGAGEADDWYFLGASIYGLLIGEKTTDGNYPITIIKINDVKGIQRISATTSIDETTGDFTVTTDSAPSGEAFVLSFGKEGGGNGILMVKQLDGSYAGYYDDAETALSIHIEANGTGSAFPFASGFLYRSFKETDGKVLTIQGKRAQWLDPQTGGSSLPDITATDVGKFLTVTSNQKTAWGSVPQGSPIEIVLDESKPYFNLGEYNDKVGVFILSRPNNAILYEAKYDNDSATFTKILLYGGMKADAQDVDYLNVSGSLYGLNSNSSLTYIGSGAWQLTNEDNYKFLPYPYSQEASLCCAGGISGAIPAFTLYGAAIGKTSPDYIGLLPQVCKYCALRYDFKKTSSTTDTEKVASAFFGSVSADDILTPTKITLIGIFDNGMGKAVLEKNASGVFESKTPIEYVADVNAVTYSKSRYKHVVNLSFKEAGVTKLSAIFTGYNSSNLPIDSYQDLTKLFAGETIELHGKVIVDGTARDTKYLDLHGGGINTDNIAYYAGTGNDPLALVAINLDQFPGLTLGDDVCFPK